MKFEKINDNILRIVLSFDELPDCNSLADLMSNTELAKSSFLHILDKAGSMVGFDTTDYKVKIQAQSLHNGNFVITITKLMEINGKRKVVTPKRVHKDAQVSSNFIIYRFYCFDDFLSFCSCLKNNKFLYLNRFVKFCYLYDYSNSYFLVLSSINERHKQIGLFYSLITEFSEFATNKDLLYFTLKEHGELVFDNNALITGQKFC